MDHLLVLSGSPKEIIDGVRYFANHAHPENHGAEAAKLLTAQGYKILLVQPDASIISASDLIRTAAYYAGQDIKAVLNLANISSIRPAQTSAQKLKVKKEAGHGIPMEVVGNVDAWEKLQSAFPGIPVIGYRDNQLVATIDNPLAKTLITVIPAKAGIQPASAQITSGTGALSGHKIIVTSGPTAEKLTTGGDVITNLSTGRQGTAIAEALAKMGAQVIFITATTAREMYDQVMASLPADAYIGVAAVADFGVESPINLQLKENEPYTLQLVQSPDILQAIGTHPTLRPKVVIGFAAETGNLLEYARAKLEKKGADAICANWATAAGNDKNQITWVTKNGNASWETMDKHAIGHKIGAKIVQMFGSTSGHVKL